MKHIVIHDKDKLLAIKDVDNIEFNIENIVIVDEMPPFEPPAEGYAGILNYSEEKGLYYEYEDQSTPNNEYGIPNSVYQEIVEKTQQEYHAQIVPEIEQAYRDQLVQEVSTTPEEVIADEA